MLLDRIRQEIEGKLSALRSMQNPDGGIPAYVKGDESGVWVSAEVLATVTGQKLMDLSDRFSQRLASFIATHQHPDGGWSYRGAGDSFTDPTAWALVALSFYDEHAPAIVPGLDCLLALQHAAGDTQDGWGIQGGEPDRIYSTVTALHALSRLRDRSCVPASRRGDIDGAITAALQFVIASKNSDGGWGARPKLPSNAASTAQALRCLFNQGISPTDCKTSLDFLLQHRNEPLAWWESVDEVLPLRMGLEVTMQWFTHPEVLQAFLPFAEVGMIDIGTLAKAVEGLFLFSVSQDEVNYSRHGATRPYTWTIPHYIDALCTASTHLKKHRSDYTHYTKRVEQEERSRQRKLLMERLQTRFPYPVAETFLRFVREPDSLGQFRRLILSFECLLTFCTSAAVIAYSHSSKGDEAVSSDLTATLGRPQLGDWLRLLQRMINSAATENDPYLTELRSALGKKVSGFESESVTDVRSVLDRFLFTRNKYWGHGGMMSGQEYKLLVAGLRDGFEALLTAFAFLEQYSLFFVTETEFNEFEEKEIYTIVNCTGIQFGDRLERIECARRLSRGMSEPELRYLYLQDGRSGSTLNLYPLWLMTHCNDCKADRFFCLSKRSSESLDYLSYECGHALRLANAKHLEALMKRLQWEGRAGGTPAV